MSERNRKMVQDYIERDRIKNNTTPAQDSDVKKSTLENKYDSGIEYGGTQQRHLSIEIEEEYMATNNDEIKKGKKRLRKKKGKNI